MKTWLFRSVWVPAAAIVLACLAAVDTAQAAVIKITVNTSALSGLNGRFEFDLFDGDGLVNNTATIYNLTTDGVPGVVDCTIGCIGGPPYILDDSLGFGSLLQDLVLGSTFSFLLDYSNNFTAGLPDQFALFLLDPDTNFSLVDTSLDFRFGDALALVTLNGTDDIQSADANVTVDAIPEPGTALLLTLCLPLLLLRKRLAQTTL